jgi:NAD(P)-dependent dehydrogenase (short-subunit alcohol dehydrogenase family)
MTKRLEELHLDEVELAAQIPARRLGRARDFAAVAAFLASDQAGYLTGQAIACDGGFAAVDLIPHRTAGNVADRTAPRVAAAD